MGNKKSGKTKMVNEKSAREFSKVNMEAAEDMGMPSRDKKRKNGKGNSANQLK